MLPELILIEFYFTLKPLEKHEHAFCGNVLSIFRSFFVRVILCSISLSMCLSPADDVPITNPRTLKPSSIAIFVPSNTFLALSRQFPS